MYPQAFNCHFKVKPVAARDANQTMQATQVQAHVTQANQNLIQGIQLAQANKFSSSTKFISHLSHHNLYGEDVNKRIQSTSTNRVL